MTKLSEMTEEQWATWVDDAIGINDSDKEFSLSEDWLTQVEWEEPFVDPYLYVIGMDPGGTTGVACLRLLFDTDVETTIQTAQPELGYLHQIADGRYGFKDFFGGSVIAHNVIIVSEKWKERNVKGADREPQYIEGGIHMLWGDENVVWQYPDQKELIPDQWLKDNNLWTEGKRHQMDALKHAFAYLRNNGNSATLNSLSGQGDGDPMAQPGDADSAQLGEPQEGAGQPNMTEVMEGLTEAAQDAAEAMEDFAEAFGEPADADDGEGWGEPLGSGDDTTPHGHGEGEEDKRNRSRREVNGAFAGYSPADEEIESVTILFEE